MRPEQFVDFILKRTSETVSSLRRQAPGARMIGEFAVKQVTKEAEKIKRRFLTTTDADPDTTRTEPNES